MQSRVMNCNQGRCYVPRRYVFLFLSFFGVLNVFVMRVSLSMTMVVMVNSTEVLHSDERQSVSECPDLNQRGESEMTKSKVGRYNWNTNMQGLILGAAYVGILITQFPGAVLSERFGAKWVLGVPIFLSSIMNLLIPLAADWGAYALVIVRVLQGLLQGVLFPSINVMIAKWSHKLERSRFVSIIYSGFHLGIVVSMAMTGWLISTEILGGWPSCFYVYGISGCVWFMLWATLVHESPEEHPNISEKEFNYLESCREIPKEKTAIPWKAICTSMPVWAALIADTGSEIGLVLFIVEMPTYLNSVLQFNILHDGLLLALGFTIQAIFAWFTSFIADFMRKSSRMSITNIRKLFTSLALFGPAVCLLGIAFSGCHLVVTIGLITISRAFNACLGPGAGTTPLDLSPAFVGTIKAIIYTLGSFYGILTPPIIGAIVINKSTAAQWNFVFCVVAVMQVLSGVFFLVFSSAELQPWGRGDFDSSNNENNKGQNLSNDGDIFIINSSASVGKSNTGRDFPDLNSKCPSEIDPNSDWKLTKYFLPTWKRQINFAISKV